MSEKIYNAKDTVKTSARKKNRDMEYMDTHQKRVPLNFKLDDYARLKAAADTAGQPVGTYIKQAIKERMERDQKAGANHI